MGSAGPGRRPSAVVCVGQSGVNALATIRSLGRRGIPVHAVSICGSGQIAAKSRYCVSHRQAADMQSLIDVLRRLAAEAGEDSVLYVDNDRMMRALEPDARELQQRFRVVEPLARASALTDKRVQVRVARGLGLKVPRTCLPSSWRAIESFGRQARGRLVAKPIEHGSHAGAKFKVTVAPGADELIHALKQHGVEPSEVMVQEFIEGADCDIYVALCYRDRNGASHVFTARKLRQMPLGAGVMSIGAPVDSPEVRAMTLRLAEEIDLRGVISTEFKYDPASGEHYFIEWNPRPGAFQSLAWQAGFDLAYLAYCDRAGIDCAAEPNYASGHVWIDAALEIDNLVRRPSLLLEPRTLRALLSKKEFAVLSWDDIGPFRAASARLAKDLATRAWDKLARHIPNVSDPIKSAVFGLSRAAVQSLAGRSMRAKAPD